MSQLARSVVVIATNNDAIGRGIVNFAVTNQWCCI